MPHRTDKPGSGIKGRRIKPDGLEGPREFTFTVLFDGDPPEALLDKLREIIDRNFTVDSEAASPRRCVWQTLTSFPSHRLNVKVSYGVLEDLHDNDGVTGVDVSTTNPPWSLSARGQPFFSPR